MIMSTKTPCQGTGGHDPWARTSQENKVSDECYTQQADIQLVFQVQEELQNAVHPQLHQTHSTD